MNTRTIETRTTDLFLSAFDANGNDLQIAKPSSTSTRSTDMNRFAPTPSRNQIPSTLFVQGAQAAVWLVALLVVFAAGSIAKAVTIGSDYYEIKILTTGSGPSLYWRLGESSVASPADNLGSLGAAADGTYGPATGLLVAGAIANTTDTAAFFNTGATTSSVTASALSFPQSSFSAEFWINAPSAGGGHGIVSYNSPGGENDFLIFNTNDLNFFLNTQVATGIDVSDGTWHHVVATWDAGTGDLNVYDNAGTGVPSFTQAGFQIGNIPAILGDLVLGQEQDGTGASGSYTTDAGQALAGALDEFALYPFVLTPAQVAQHYNVGIGELFDPNAIPEPSTGLLLGLGAVWMLGDVRRRKHHGAARSRS